MKRWGASTLGRPRGSRSLAIFAHGLLMYLDHPGQVIAQLSKRVSSGGLLSITFKNAHGLAMRPALRGEPTPTAGSDRNFT